MTLTGEDIRRLMRRHKWTIRRLARQWDLTQKRVRDVRDDGVTGFTGDNWYAMITGRWPDGVKAKPILPP